MHFFFIVAAICLIALFWRAFFAVMPIGAITLGLVAFCSQPQFDTVPTASLQPEGLAAWDDTAEASVCNQLHGRALDWRTSADDVRPWAYRHPCPAKGDPNSASSPAQGARGGKRGRGGARLPVRQRHPEMDFAL
jgi:hypothetical protein